MDGGEEVVGNGRQQLVPPEQGVAHDELREVDAPIAHHAHRAALEEDAAVADVAGVPQVPIPSGGREVVEGEAVGGAGDGARGGGVGVGRLGGLEARGHGLDEAEEERRVEGAVPAEERGVGDEAAEGGARGGGASEVRGAGDPEEDLLQEVDGECGRPPGRRRGLGEAADRQRHLPGGGRGVPRLSPATRGRGSSTGVLAGQRSTNGKLEAERSSGVAEVRGSPSPRVGPASGPSIRGVSSQPTNENQKWVLRWRHQCQTVIV